MDRSRWIYVAVGLMVAFFVSVAVGAFVGRQLKAPPSPIAIASPSPKPSSAPTVSPSPTLTNPPTRPPTAAPVPTPPPETLSAEGFAQELAAAIGQGDDEYLFEHLHPATIERYGEQACRAYVAGIEGEVNWEILGSSGPAPWSYETDGLATTIEDAWAVSIRQPGADPEVRDVHYAQAEGTWRWFTDCGDPV